MNAVEFVKKFGVGLTKEIISDGILENYCRKLRKVISPHLVGFSFNDLKQILDAFELVEKRGGLAEAKAVEQQYWNSGVGSAMIISMELKQAIELAEKCNES